jgi:ribonuclease D
MNLSIPLSKPQLVLNEASLKNLAQKLNRQTIVAVDTESNSLHAYREQVCLIQFSIPEADYLIDTMAFSNLAELGNFFNNNSIEKVFHAAEYDLICLKRDFHFEFQNIFDTMIAARILGRGEVGLSSILASEFNIHQDKRFQRADWGKRPLSDEQLSYAQLDTHFLIPIRDKLYKQLEEKNLLSLAQEDFKRGCQVNGRNNHEGKNQDCWRISGSHDLSPQQAAVLNELCHYRDKVARTANRPLFKIMGDETLLKIALKCPKKVDELSSIPGMTKNQINRHGESIIRLVKVGVKAKPLYPTRQARPDVQYLNRLEKLRTWRKKTGAKIGVQSDIVLPRNIMHLLAQYNPHSAEDLATLLNDVPWRLEHYGEQILEVLNK